MTDWLRDYVLVILGFVAVAAVLVVMRNAVCGESCIEDIEARRVVIEEARRARYFACAEERADMIQAVAQDRAALMTALEDLPDCNDI